MGSVTGGSVYRKHDIQCIVLYYYVLLTTSFLRVRGQMLGRLVVSSRIKSDGTGRAEVGDWKSCMKDPDWSGHEDG